MLDLSKPVRFRNDPDWKIINIVENPLGNKDSKLIVNAIARNGHVDCWFCAADGSYCQDKSEHRLDLVNYDSKYRNIYSNGDVGISYRSRDRADEETSRIRIAVLRIDDDKTAHLEKV